MGQGDETTSAPERGRNNNNRGWARGRELARGRGGGRRRVTRGTGGIRTRALSRGQGRDGGGEVRPRLGGLDAAIGTHGAAGDARNARVPESDAALVLTGGLRSPTKIGWASSRGDVLGRHARATNPHLVPPSKQSEDFVASRAPESGARGPALPEEHSSIHPTAPSPPTHTVPDVVLRGDDGRTDARRQRVQRRCLTRRADPRVLRPRPPRAPRALARASAFRDLTPLASADWSPSPLSDAPPPPWSRPARPTRPPR